MDNSGLVELLKTLTADELRGFSEFLAVGHFNRGKHWKEAQALFAALAPHAPHFDSPELTKEALSPLVFPGLPFTEARLEKVMVKLLKSLRAFILVEDYLREENQPNAQADFAKSLLRRRLNKRASNVAQSLQSSIEKMEAKSAADFDLLFRLSSLHRGLDSQQNTWKKDLRIGESLRYLDLHFIANRIGLLNQYLLLSKLARMELSIDIEREQALLAAVDVGAEESPAIFIGKKIFEMFSGPADPAPLVELVDRLETLKGKMAADELAECYAFLRSHCSILIQSGHAGLWPLLSKIQQANLADGHFYSNGLLAPGSFFNIFNTALKADRADWALQFIEEHKDRIAGENESRDYYRLCQAYHLFHSGEFGRALDLIPPASANLDFHLIARRLELKAYYETGSELLPYKMNAFKMTLHRGRKGLLSEHNYEMNNNFLNILSQLAQSKPGDKKRGEIILRRIEEKGRIISKDWLIEKARAI